MNKSLSEEIISKQLLVSQKEDELMKLKIELEFIMNKHQANVKIRWRDEIRDVMKLNKKLTNKEVMQIICTKHTIKKTSLFMNMVSTTLSIMHRDKEIGREKSGLDSLYGNINLFS